MGAVAPGETPVPYTTFTSALLKQSNTVCGRELMDHGDIQDQVGLFSDVRIPDLEVAAQPVL